MMKETFTGNIMENYSINIGLLIILNVAIFRSEQFKQFRLNFNAYLCLDLSVVDRVTTEDLYTYYKASGKLCFLV